MRDFVFKAIQSPSASYDTLTGSIFATSQRVYIFFTVSPPGTGATKRENIVIHFILTNYNRAVNTLVVAYRLR